MPDLANPFFASVSRAVTLAAEADGYSVIVGDSREQTAHEVRLLEQLQDRQVEAFVVCPVGQASEHLVAIHDRGTPIVLADRTFPESSLLQVTSEHFHGAEKATRLLVDNGHRVIGILQGLPDTLPNEQRLKGHMSTLKKSGIDYDASLISGDNFTEQSGYEATLNLLNSRPDITALFAVSTPNAMGALRAAKELGRTVPNNLSIVTFDDSPFADLMRVPLTTVCQDVEQLGQLAASLVMKAIDPKNRKRKTQHEIKTRIAKRDSISRV